MRVKFESKIIDLNNTINVTSYGETEISDPVMIYAQIPIEREKYIELTKRCRERKISIYDLLEMALDPDGIDPF